MHRLFRLWPKSKSKEANEDTPTEAELCLLLCSIYPEDSRIPIEDLILFGKGLNWFQDVHETIEAINRVRYHQEISRFDGWFSVELHLEEDEDGNEYVRMPIGTHKVASLVASRHELVFWYETVMNDWPHVNTYEYCQGLSLVLKNLRKNPLSLEFPNLELLQLRYRGESECLPNTFFNGMKNLRVLSLDARLLPCSLHVLRNLRTLRLRVHKLENAGWIGGLISLESLVISTVSSTEFPVEMRELYNLKMLDLREMNIAHISAGVLSRMLKLEELYLPLSFKWWGCKVTPEIRDYDDEDKCSYGEERINASLSEIWSLSLKTLEIGLLNVSVLPKNSTIFTNLLHFKIIFGSHQSIYRRLTNELQLTGDAFSIKESGICHLISTTECLSLIRVRNLTTVMYQLEDTVFERLKKLIVSECDELEHVVDTRGLWVRITLFWELESLHLSMLPNLRGICKGPMLFRFSLYNLREISIRFCHKLRYVFPLLMTGKLEQLQSIEILKCDEIEGIFYKNKGKDYDYTNVHNIHWNFLRNLHLHSLPKLASFFIQDATTYYEQLMNQEISTNPSVSTDQSSLSLVNLWNVSKHHTEAYSGFSPSLTNTSLEGLEKLKIAFCDAIKVVFLFDGIDAGSGVLSSLKELELFGLRNLRHIWLSISQKITGFQNLQLLALSKCSNKYVFSSQAVKHLVQLQKIQISRCEEMEEIVVEDEEEDEIVFPKLKALELQYMPNFRIFYGGTCTIEFSVLESLKLNKCSKMDTFCYKSPKTPMLERVQLNQSSHPILENLNATIKRFPMED